VGNWRQLFEARKAKKNRVTTRRQTGTLVRPFTEMMWPGPQTYKTMDSKKLLWATGVSQIMREKWKNPLTTRRQTRILLRSFSEMMWFGPT